MQFRSYLVAVGFALLAVLARIALDPLVGIGSSLPIVLLAIMAASAYGGTGPGLIALVVGGVGAEVLFHRPSALLDSGFSAGIELLLYAITGVAIAIIAGRLAAAKRDAQSRSQEALQAKQLIEREIEQRQHAEAEIARLNTELKRRVQELELLLQDSPVGIAFTRDPDCREIWANAAYLRLTQLPPGTNVSLTTNANLPLQFFCNGRALEPNELPIQRCITSAAAIVGEELEARLADGSSVFMLVNVTPLAEDGRVRGAIATAVDITERKQVEQSLRASEARERLRVSDLEAIMEAVPAAVFIAEDTSGQVIRANRTGYDMLRVSPGINISKSMPLPELSNFRVLHDGIELSSEQLPVQRAAKGEDVRNFEEDIVFNDGSVAHWIGNAVPLRDERGQVRGAVAAFVDITERKRTEAELRDNIDLFRGMAEGMPHMVWQSDARGMNHYQNQVWYDYIGAAPGSSFGADWLQFYHPDDRDYVMNEWAQSLRTEGAHPYDIEARIRRHDGEYRWFRIKGTPIRSAAGQVTKWAGTCTDIEDHKHAVESLKQADRHKDEFLATLGHELRNPLAPIRNAIEIIRKGLNDERRRAWAVEVIDRQLHQLSRIIDDLLALAKIASGQVELKREPVGMRAAVSRASETTRPLMEAKGQRLRVELPESDAVLDADPARLVQAIANLLNNAARYTPRGGMILVAGANRGDRVELRVRDSGDGIDPKDLPRVFDMFRPSPVASAEGGLGIGLAFAKRMIELHDGRISVHSDGVGPGKGAEFRIELPRRDSAAAAWSTEQRRAPSAAAGRKRVLVVDDSRDTADSLTELLRMHGHDVDCLYEGAQVLQKALAFRPDLVLLDIGLPDIPGYEVARQLRAEASLRLLPLAALTGRGQEADKQHARDAGFDIHFTKPVDIAELIGFVDSIGAANNEKASGAR